MMYIHSRCVFRAALAALAARGTPPHGAVVEKKFTIYLVSVYGNKPVFTFNTSVIRMCRA